MLSRLTISIIAGWYGLMVGPCMANSAEYWSLAEFHQQFPAQAKLEQSFDLLVQGESQPLAIEQQAEVRIFVVTPGYQMSDYWRRSTAAFTARLDELKIKYQIYNHYTRLTVATEQQQRLLEKAERYQPDYLIFTLDVSEHTNLVTHVLEQNKTKLILQNITNPYKAWQATPPFLYVGFDHRKGTQLLHQYFTQYYPKANYAVAYRSPGYISEMRGDSFIQWQDQQGAKLIDAQYSDGSKYGAAIAANNMLTKHPDLDFIYACSTDVAFGVIDVLARKNLTNKVMVNGWGGGDNELAAVLSGQMEVTVMRMNDDSGVAIAEAIKLDLQGQGKLVPQVYSGEFKLVDKRINPATLEEYKKRAFRYSSAAQ